MEPKIALPLLLETALTWRLSPIVTLLSLRCNNDIALHNDLGMDRHTTGGFDEQQAAL
ncbi:hypothetical protein [uncultured Bosea sp.]|uniref:hypothetical protein n=1 Tax=uncultured Bosea sp. TaxID=211457 RepID=UPI0025F3D108|nr:hypothetical protein [uncultured Bosea sp.]